MAATHFIVGDTCNNGCRGCLWTRRLDFLPFIGLPLSADVRGHGVRLAGREPLMRKDLAEVVRSIRAAGASGVEIETNGRGLAFAGVAGALRDAGVTRIAVKLFASEEAPWDAHTRVPGSYTQTLRGIAVTRRVAPLIDLVAVLVPRRAAGAGLRELVDFARRLGFAQARVELRLAKLDLTGLTRLAADVRALHENPPPGMRIDVATA
jgi:molybdenum cofactor biosynthesis enzyme MoaA